MKQIAPQFVFRDEVRCFFVELDQLPYGTGVGFLGSLAFAA
jgi:hypothetical protein